MAKWAGWVGFGLGAGQMGHRLKTGSGRAGLTRIFPMNFIFYFLFYKENNMYLPFGKLCNKLLDVKCIIFNSLLISRMNSVKLIQ